MTINTESMQRAKALRLHGLVAHWDEVNEAPWVEMLLNWEEAERCALSLERRLKQARLGRFKPLSDFDWSWPKKCDQSMVHEWMQLDFIETCNNLIICGPNGVGKTTIARNVVHQAVLNGHTALFTTVADMLNELAAQDSDRALQRKLHHYAKPDLVAIDELGYLSYSNRHADLLMEVVSRRYEYKPIIITTNKPFKEWTDIFPNASCVVSVVDRLVHHSEIITIEAESFRLKEATEQSEQRREARKPKTSPTAQ